MLGIQKCVEVRRKTRHDCDCDLKEMLESFQTVRRERVEDVYESPNHILIRGRRKRRKPGATFDEEEE